MRSFGSRTIKEENAFQRVVGLCVNQYNRKEEGTSFNYRASKEIAKKLIAAGLGNLQAFMRAYGREDKLDEFSLFLTTDHSERFAGRNELFTAMKGKGLPACVVSTVHSEVVEFASLPAQIEAAAADPALETKLINKKRNVGSMFKAAWNKLSKKEQKTFTDLSEEYDDFGEEEPEDGEFDLPPSDEDGGAGIGEDDED